MHLEECMHELSYSVPGVSEEIDACREMASEAIVNLTYFVTEPLSAADHSPHISTSLSTAFELWMNVPARKLSVAFDWSVGDESGRGIIRYDGEKNPTILQRLVGRLIHGMAVRKVAEQLFERIPRSMRPEAA
jgi:hypothetical protein